MKLKDLISVIDDNAFLNIISESRRWLFMDKAVYITPDLLERTIKEIDIIRNEFFITLNNHYYRTHNKCQYN